MGGFRKDKHFMEESMRALKVRNVEVPSVYFSVSSDVLFVLLYTSINCTPRCQKSQNVRFSAMDLISFFDKSHQSLVRHS